MECCVMGPDEPRDHFRKVGEPMDWAEALLPKPTKPKLNYAQRQAKRAEDVRLIMKQVGYNKKTGKFDFHRFFPEPTKPRPRTTHKARATKPIRRRGKHTTFHPRHQQRFKRKLHLIREKVLRGGKWVRVED